MSLTPSKSPSVDLDLFTDAAIANPIPLERAVRDAGPAVWLSAHDVWAIGRYDDVRAALRANEVLVSGRGVALNPRVNANPGPSTILSDGAIHRTRRKIVMAPMMPRPLAEVKSRIDQLAMKLVDDLIGRAPLDGIADFARYLPVAVVSHLVGLPEEGRERMLDWAQATFNALGPANERGAGAAQMHMEMIEYVSGLDPATVDPKGWAAGLFAAADDEGIDVDEARRLLIDYIAPSLDTTILGTGHMLWLLGAHPDQYARVREDPDLIPNAVHESLRLGSPVRAFTRFATEDYDVDGVTIPKGDRVVIFYGAANRDERHYPDPLRFDVTRDAKDHLAFGYGVHRCGGGHLAQLELESLLRALVDRVERIEVGEPERLMSNMLEGYARFEVRFS